MCITRSTTTEEEKEMDSFNYFVGPLTPANRALHAVMVLEAIVLVIRQEAATSMFPRKEAINIATKTLQEAVSATQRSSPGNAEVAEFARVGNVLVEIARAHLQGHWGPEFSHEQAPFRFIKNVVALAQYGVSMWDDQTSHAVLTEVAKKLRAIDPLLPCFAEMREVLTAQQE